jgi:branched-chain amino acid transport system substrate-binding protein
MKFASIGACLGLVGALLMGTGAGNAAQQGVTDDSIEIGMHSSMTGAASAFGVAYAHVAQIVFDKINEQGGINGRKIHLIVEDDRSDAGAGVAAVTKLLNRDKVFLVIGGNYTPVAVAVMNRVIDRDMIYWSASSSTPILTNPFHRLTFQAQVSNGAQAVSATKLALSMNPKKIAFIGENNEYGRIIHDATAAELKKKGIEIASDQTIEVNTTSAASHVLKIKQSGADLLIYGGTPGPLSFILREIYSQGLKIPVVSFAGGATQAIFDLVTSEAPVEYYAVSPIACRLTDPCAAEFMKEWKAHYPNEAPLVFGAHGYAVFGLFAEGLKQAGKDLTTDSLVSAFETMPPYKTPLAAYPLKFTSDDHRAMHGAFLTGFKNGKQYFFGDEVKK